MVILNKLYICSNGGEKASVVIENKNVIEIDITAPEVRYFTFI